MKLAVFFLMLSFLQVSAASYAQKVSLHVKNASLKQVFYQLTKQTGYSFLCDADLIKDKKTFSINLNNVSIKEVLDECFTSPDVLISFNSDNTVMIKKKVISEIQNSIIITGNVTDDKNLPIPGVTITVKDTRIATVSGNDGSYKITVPGESSTLVFTSIGFQRQEVLVGKNTKLNITLLALNAGLNEVVVIGYGNQKRSDLTGSITSLKGDELVKSTDVSMNGAIQGKLAGVQVVSADGAPGANVSVYVRGGSSISASNDPLYVIDGYPVFGGNNIDINPSDIETIDVLKDASATAIYGSRGANGVVIITTKSAKGNTTNFTYDTYAGVQKINKKYDVLTAQDYAQMMFTITNIAQYSTWQTTWADSTSVNWQDVVYRNAILQNHSFGFSSGTEKSKIFGSIGYTKQDGIAIATGFNRLTGYLNGEVTPNKIFKTGFNINLNSSNTNGAPLSGYNGIGTAIITGLPYVAKGDFNAILNTFLIGDGLSSSVDNPYIELQHTQINRNDNSYRFGAFAQINITPKLFVKISAGMRYDENILSSFYDNFTQLGALYNGNASISNVKNVDLLNENTINYTSRIGKGALDLLAGFTVQDNVTSSNVTGARGFPIQSLGYNNLALASIILTPTSNKSEYALQSFLGRANYSYLNRYLFTVSIRADGSSKFSDQKWGYFPSAALAWKLNEESFLRNNNTISTLKLRASYGMTGNQSIPPYSSLSNYTAYNPVINNTTVVGLLPSTLGNKALKWETTIQSDLGIDLGLLKDRISLTTDLYIKKSKDLLLNAPISYYSGFQTVFRNIGDIEVKGVEVSLNTVNLEGKIKWTTNFNIASNRSKVLRLADNQAFFTTGTVGRWTGTYIVQVGQPLGTMYGYQADGVYHNTQEIAAGPTQTGVTLVPGSERFKDVSGANGVPDGKIDAFDRTVIGNGNPDFFGGITNNITYARFDLNILFTYSYGNDVLNAAKMQIENASIYHGGSKAILTRWTAQTPDVSKQAWGLTSPEYDQLTSNVVENGSYLRLKTLMLGYSVPNNLLKRIGIKKIRAYLSGTNLWTWTKYTGYDPEVSSLGGLITPGVDLVGYPHGRIYTLGLNIGF